MQQTETFTKTLSGPLTLDKIREIPKQSSQRDDVVSQWYRRLEEIIPDLTKSLQVSADQLILPAEFMSGLLGGEAVDYIDVHPTTEATKRICVALMNQASRVSSVKIRDSVETGFEPRLEPGDYRIRGLLSGGNDALNDLSFLFARLNSANINVPSQTISSGIAGSQDPHQTTDATLRSISSTDLKQLCYYKEPFGRSQAVAELIGLAVCETTKSKVIEHITTFSGQERSTVVHENEIRSSLQGQAFLMRGLLGLQAIKDPSNIELSPEYLGAAGAEILLQLTDQAQTSVRQELLPVICRMLVKEFSAGSSEASYLNQSSGDLIKRIAKWADDVPGSARSLVKTVKHTVPYLELAKAVLRMTSCDNELRVEILGDVLKGERDAKLPSHPEQSWREKRDHRGLSVIAIAEYCAECSADNDVKQAAIRLADAVITNALTNESAKYGFCASLCRAYLLKVRLAPDESTRNELREAILDQIKKLPTGHSVLLLGFARAFPDLISTDDLRRKLDLTGCATLMLATDPRVANLGFELALTRIDQSIQRASLKIARKDDYPEYLVSAFADLKGLEFLFSALGDSQHVTLHQKATILEKIHHFFSFGDELKHWEWEINRHEYRPIFPAILQAYKKNDIRLPLGLQFLRKVNADSRPQGTPFIEETATKSLQQILSEYPAESAAIQHFGQATTPLKLQVIQSHNPNNLPQEALDLLQSWEDEDQKERQITLDAFPANETLALQKKQSPSVDEVCRAMNLHVQSDESLRDGIFRVTLPGDTSFSKLLWLISQRLNISVVATTGKGSRPDLFRKPSVSADNMGSLCLNLAAFAGPWDITIKDLAQGVAGAILSVKRHSKQLYPLQGFVQRSHQEANDARDGTSWLNANIDLLATTALAIAASRSPRAIRQLAWNGYNHALSFLRHYESLLDRIDPIDSSNELPMRIESSRSNSEELVYFDIFRNTQGRSSHNLCARLEIPADLNCSYWLSLDNELALSLTELSDAARTKCLIDIKTALSARVELLGNIANIFSSVDGLAAQQSSTACIIAKVMEVPPVQAILNEYYDIFSQLGSFSTLEEQ